MTPAAAQTITFAAPGAQNFGTTPTLTATATSGLSVAFSSATTGVCTITGGGALTFVAAGTCTINANQAGNTSFLAAPTVSRSFTVNAVVPGAPTIGTATAGNVSASVAFSAPAFNGGSAITSYTVTASPGGATASGAASPITVAGLTNGTSYTFTVTATNAIGTGAASAASNSVTPAVAVAPSQTTGTFTIPSNSIGSLTGQGNVTLGGNSTLYVNNSTSISGSTINLPNTGPVTLVVGVNPTLTITPQATGSTLGFVGTLQNGSNMEVPSLTAGSAVFSSAGGMLTFAVDGSHVITPFQSNPGGFSASENVGTDGSTTVVVQSGSATLTYPAGNGTTAPLTVYPGDKLVFNSAGMVVSSSVSESGIGQPFAPGAAPGGFTELPPPVVITGTSPHLGGATLDSALTGAASTLVGFGLQDGGVDAQGNLHMNSATGAIVARPVGISLDPTAPSESGLANGDINVKVAPDLVVEVSPSVANLPGFTSSVDALLGSGTSIVQQRNGTMLVTANGVTYAVRPSWTTGTTSGKAGLVFAQNGQVLTYTDGSGVSQNLYPSFANPGAVQSVLQSLDPSASITVLPDGSAAVVLSGKHYTFTPQWIVSPTPAADASSAYWSSGNVIYVNNGDGTCQGFTLSQ
ncbi:MAG: fibronectin type III domain-containing protein [Burkholderiales bacterium]|nr:fibronectin type III domain-containing protein [Burkholderiales bacterium]